MSSGTRAGWNRARLVVAGALFGAALCGCDAAQEFRAAAGDSLQTGVNAIADGLIDGIFAVFEPDATNSTSS